MVVDPPKETPSSKSSAAVDNLFVYPRNGQSEKQQADDRYSCHVWSVKQTGYDPTVVSDPPAVEKRVDYQRAMGACLDALGYSVK